MLTTAAMRAGFSGGLVIDFPHSTRAKKYFLVLMVASGGASIPQPKGLDGEEDDEEIGMSARRSKHRKLANGSTPGVSCCGGGLVPLLPPSWMLLQDLLCHTCCSRCQCRLSAVNCCSVRSNASEGMCCCV